MEIKFPGAMEPNKPPSIAPLREGSLEGASVRGSAVTESSSDRLDISKGTGASHSASPDEISNAVKELKDYVQNIQRDLQFTVDEDSGRTVITVTDAVTDETIRQIPSEEVLALARHLKELEEQHGVLIQVKA